MGTIIKDTPRGYDDFKSVNEFLDYYHLTHLSTILEGCNKGKAKKEDEADDPEGDDGRAQRTDTVEVHYADVIKSKYDNIFKHIVVFTNDRNSDNNKTLKNIQDAIKNLKKAHCTTIPYLHVFVAADIEVD